MSYSVTGVAAISFPLPVLQSDPYSVPGSHRALATPHPDAHSGSNAPVTANAQTNAAAPSKVTEVKHVSPVDTVTLTTSQKVLRLQREGESPLQIAAKLNLPAKEVQVDLHIDTHVAQTFTVAPVSASPSGNTTATVSVPTIGA